MLYHITRNGQSYGPYTREDLQRYVVSGNILFTDLAKSDDMPDWVPVSQILDQNPDPTLQTPFQTTSSGYVPPGHYAAAAASHAAAQPFAFPDPPNLHWLLLLILTFFTCGLFLFIYDFVQAIWVTKIVPGSRVVIYLAAMIVLSVLMGSLFFSQFAAIFGAMKHPANPQHFAGSYLLTMLFIYPLMFAFYWVFIEYRFTMRDQILAHFNQHGPEPIGVKIGAGWTFFFGGLCFQYHFNRINAIKRAAN